MSLPQIPDFQASLALADAAAVKQPVAVANEAALTGKPRDQYELTETGEMVAWNGAKITSRGRIAIVDLDTIDQLTAYAGGANTVTVRDTVRGGVFVRRTVAVVGAADGGVRIAHSDSRYVWHRLFTGHVQLRWYPPAADSTDALTKAQAAAQTLKTHVKINAGVWTLHHVEHVSGVQIYGDGMDTTILAAREDNTYYIIGANVTTTDLNPAQNMAGAGLFDVTLRGRSDTAPESGKHHLLWLNGVTGYRGDNIRGDGGRGDVINIGVGNAPTAKKRNYDVRFGYVEARDGRPIVYRDTTTGQETTTFDRAKWDAKTLVTARGGNRNPVTITEGERIHFDHIHVEDFGHPMEPGGFDVEPNNANAGAEGNSARHISIGKISVVRGRGNFSAVSWVTYKSNADLISATGRGMHTLTVGEISVQDSPLMHGLVVKGAETARSATSGHNINVGKISASNSRGTSVINGVWGVTLEKVAVPEGTVDGAASFGMTYPVGDITLRDSNLPGTTVNGYSLEIGAVDGFTAPNTTLTSNGTNAAVLLTENKTSKGIDLSGARFSGTGTKAVVAGAGHVQTPQTNRAPLYGWGAYTSALQTPVLPPDRAPVAQNVDLNAAAVYADTFPAGYTVFAFNGGVGQPVASGGNQGVVEVYRDTTVAATGFAYEIFHYRGAAAYLGSFIRYPVSASANAPWGVWLPLIIKPQAAPADSATQAAGANPTKTEFDALLAEVRALKAAVKNAGVLT